MRLPDSLPSNFNAPQDAKLPFNDAPLQQPEAKTTGDKALSFMPPLSLLSQSTSPGQNEQIPQKGLQQGSSPMAAMMMQMMSMMSMMLSVISGQGSKTAPAKPVDQPFPSFNATSGSEKTQGSDATQKPQGKGDQMSFEEVISTLGRHENLLKKAKDINGMKEMIKDPDTPADAKKAPETLVNNPAMFKAIDPAKNGEMDGKISSKDIRKWQDTPEMKAYNDAKAETYTHNYVPSDAKPGSKAREMTQSDALRELFRYSESLPGKKISLETLQKIADGSQDMGKCPPQVAAAAKYFVQNPGEWQQLTGKTDAKGSVSRDRLCDIATENVKLSPQEDKAFETVKNNKDIFKNATPEKLAKIANDESNSKEVRDAANLLAQPNSMLFSMMDNAKHGAGGNFFNKANDKKIGGGDIDAFDRKRNHEVASPPQYSAPAKDIWTASAKQDMDLGQQNQPDPKKEKGGGIYKLLDALSYLTVLIPGAGAVGLAANIGRVAITEGIKAGVKEGVKQGIKTGVEAGQKELAKEGTKDALKEGGKEIGKETGKTVAKKEATEEAQQEYKEHKGNPDVNAPTVWAQ